MASRSRLARGVGFAGAGFAALYGYAWYATRRYEDLEPESAGAPGSFLDVDGVRLHYVEAGVGEPVVLVHGFCGSTFSFRHTIPELAQRFRVIAVDLKGFGYSARPAGGDYSHTASAALVGRLLDRLGVTQATVVGHSMGGWVTMSLALQRPDRISRIVLVDAATNHELLRGRRFTPLVRPLLPIGGLLTIQRASFRAAAVRSAVHDPAFVTPAVVDGYFRPMRVRGHLRALGRLFSHRLRDAPLPPERLRQPTLIMWGEHDRVVPPARAHELAQLIPNSRLVIIRSAGHLPLEEQPEESNRVLLSFLGLASTAEEEVPSPPSARLEAPP